MGIGYAHTYANFAENCGLSMVNVGGTRGFLLVKNLVDGRPTHSPNPGDSSVKLRYLDIWGYLGC